jgi:hypothetical protein
VQFLNFTRGAVGDELGSTMDAVESGVAVGDGDAFTFAATPLSQMSLLPFLIQVNFFPAIVCVSPALGHFDPGFNVLALANES